MNHSAENEIRAILKSSSGKKEAFTQIVAHFKERVYWYARRIVISHEDATDVTQDVFLKVWNNLDSFKGESTLNTWLYRIATNEALNFLKSKRRQMFVNYDDVKSELANKLRFGQYISGDEISIKLEEAVLQLPEQQRIIFILRYFEDKKYAEISEITGTSEGALHASYHHAVKKIEKILSGD